MRTMGLNVALSDYCLMCKESRGGRACGVQTDIMGREREEGERVGRE